MKQMLEVLEKVYNNLELRATICPIFMGNPGLGKSFVVNAFKNFAKKNKVNFIDFFGTADYDPELVQYIGSQISPMEVSGIGIPDRDLKQMVYYNFNKLAKLKAGDILFLDELPNSNPSVLNALLTLIESRVMISGDKLPDIMIIAAGNWQGMTPLTPQIKERFVWYDIKFNAEMWQNYMKEKYKMPKSISDKMCKLITAETFDGYNFNTPRSLDKATVMLIYDCPTPYSSVIKPILNGLVSNDMGMDVDLGNGEVWKVNEQMMWLEVAKLRLKNKNNGITNE